MKAEKLIHLARHLNLDQAADELIRRSNNCTKYAIIISDYDNTAYECGLADFLQGNTKWVNMRDRDAFRAIFNDTEIHESPDHGGLC